MRPRPHRPDDLALEDAARHAAEAAALAEPDPAAAVHERQPRADTGACGAAVDLAVGEDADIGRGLHHPVVRTVGQDGAIEEGEVVGIGVRQCQAPARGLLDLHGGVDQPAERARLQVEAELGSGQDGIEGAAIADIERHGPEGAGNHDGIAGEGEAGHAFEPHPAGPPRLDLSPDEAARALDMDLGERLLPDHQPMVHGVAPEGHHRVAAHRGVAPIVQEQHRHVGVGKSGGTSRAPYISAWPRGSLISRRR